MVNKVFTTLDRIISLIENDQPRPWSTEADPGLTLLQNNGIRYERAPDGNFEAWHINDPSFRMRANNGLLAGCRLYVVNKLGEIK